VTDLRSCLIATTPHCGGQVLAAAVSAAGGLGDPREYFRPDRVPDRAAGWGVTPGGGGFVGRYLQACLSTATPATAPTGGPVFSALLQWPHCNWLVRAARTEAVGGDALDADVVAACLPDPRWVYLARPDTDRQALSWWRARHRRHAPAPLVPDLLEIRWLETIIVRRHEAWRHFFRRHGIHPLTLTLAEVLADAPTAVGRTAGHLGGGASAAGTSRRGDGPTGSPDDLDPRAGAPERTDRPEPWLATYRRARGGLPTRPGLVGPPPR
jgi:LPS sulfotransferase NodH